MEEDSRHNGQAAPGNGTVSEELIQHVGRVDGTRSTIDLSSSFLLAEFRGLEQARSAILRVRDRQLNLYIVLASAITAASVLGEAVVQPANKQAFRTSVGLALTAFPLFGIILSYRAVQAQLSSTLYLRGMSRIRYYFTQLDQDLKPYLILPLNDDIPRFGEHYFAGPLTRIFGIDIFAFVNAGIIHLGTSLLAIQTLPLSFDRRFSMLSSFLFAVVYLSAQLALHRHQMRKAQESFQAKFPSSSS